jgi:hypothetical protein
VKYIKKIFNWILIVLAAIGTFFVVHLLGKKDISETKTIYEDKKKETDKSYEDIKNIINDIHMEKAKHDKEVEDHVKHVEEDMAILDNMELIKLGNDYLEKYGQLRNSDD